MKPEHQAHLEKRGWNAAEIHHAQQILEQPRKHDMHFSLIVFWSALLVAIIANIVVSLVLIPFLVVLQGWVLHSVVVLLALVMGSLYKYLITDIGHLEKKHHHIASVVLPVLAFANLVVMVFVSRQFVTAAGVENVLPNPWIIGLVFAVSFILPYLVSVVREKA